MILGIQRFSFVRKVMRMLTNAIRIDRQIRVCIEKVPDLNQSQGSVLGWE